MTTGEVGDAGPPPCSAIEGQAFDQSCHSDSDCVAVIVGNVCGCMCKSDAINVKDESKYNAELQALLAAHPVPPPDASPTPCFCPTFGQPVCVEGHCALCSSAGPACPDAG